MKCQACLTSLPEPTTQDDEAFIRCPHCLCTNKVTQTAEGLAITLTYNPTHIDHKQKKQLINVSQDIRLYLDVLKSLNHTYTDSINAGVALYIQQLPDSTKKKVSSMISVLHKEND